MPQRSPKLRVHRQSIVQDAATSGNTPSQNAAAFGAVSPTRMHVQRERRGVSGAERREKEKEKQKKSER